MNDKKLQQLKQRHLEQLKKITENRSEQLIKEIEIAFADAPYPKSEYASGSAEHNKECEEHRESHEFFAGKSWREILGENSYRKLCGGQSYFNDWAWHYYLPAFLIQSIRRKKFNSFEFEETDWGKKRAKLLTSKQCEVIIHYLEMTLEIWKGIDENYEHDLKPLNYWKDNYQKALSREQNLNK